MPRLPYIGKACTYSPCPHHNVNYIVTKEIPSQLYDITTFVYNLHAHNCYILRLRNIMPVCKCFTCIDFILISDCLHELQGNLVLPEVV